MSQSSVRGGLRVTGEERGGGGAPRKGAQPSARGPSEGGPSGGRSSRPAGITEGQGGGGRDIAP